MTNNFRHYLKIRYRKTNIELKKSTFFKKVTIKDNEIKLFEDDLEMTYRKIRAFSHPYLGAFIKKENKKLIIWKADIEDINNNDEKIHRRISVIDCDYYAKFRCNWFPEYCADCELRNK